MRNKLNVKQKATRELEMIERKKNSTERDSMREKERKKRYIFYEKYETEINRKRTKCKRKWAFFCSHKNKIECKPTREKKNEKKQYIYECTIAKAY